MGTAEAPPLIETAPPLTFESEMAFARDQRVASIQAVEPDVVNQISITNLVNLFAGSETQCINQAELLTILTHPDEVEAMVRLGSGGEECRKLLASWKTRELARLIDSDQSELEYQAEVAPDFDTFDYCYTTMMAPLDIPAGNGQVALPFTADIFRQTTSLLLKYPQVDSDLLFNSLSTALKARQKWWIIGGRNLIDPVAEKILTEVKNINPALCARLATDMFLHKVQEDSLYLQARLHLSGSELERDINHGMFTTATGKLLDWTVKTDPTATKAALNPWIAAPHMPKLVFDRVFNHPDLNGGLITPSSAGDLSYYGYNFSINDPDKQAVHLRELSFGIFAGESEAGQITRLYLVPGFAPDQKARLTLEPIDPTSILTLRDSARVTAISPNVVNEFYRAYPELLSRVVEHLPEAYMDTLITFPGLFQYWQYLREIPLTAWDTAWDEEFKLLKRFGAETILTTLVGEHDQAAIGQIFSFLKDKINSPDAQFIEQLLAKYSQIVYRAYQVSTGLLTDGQKQADMLDVLTLRAKTLLTTSIRYAKNHNMDDKSWSQIIGALGCEDLFLRIIADPSGDEAKRWRLTRPLVEEFFQLHSPDDPESRIFLQSAFDLYLAKYSQTQQSAPYFGEMNKLRAQFYQDYVHIQSDMDKVTPDTEMDHQRLTANIRNSLAAGDLPRVATPEHPCRILFVGIGEGRAEEGLINYINSQTQGYEFYGLDVYDPQHKIAGVNYIVGSVSEVGDRFPGQFQRIYILASPLMDEVSIESLRQIMGSATSALVPGGEVFIDQAMPVGKHSYEKAAQAYHAAHPSEPPGVFYRSWPSVGGRAIGKHFIAPSVEFMLTLASEQGLTRINLPSDPKELQRQLSAVSDDDSVIVNPHQLDMDEQAWYQSHSLLPKDSHAWRHNRWNRITFRFKKTGSPSPLTVFTGRARHN